MGLIALNLESWRDAWNVPSRILLGKLRSTDGVGGLGRLLSKAFHRHFIGKLTRDSSSLCKLCKDGEQRQRGNAALPSGTLLWKKNVARKRLTSGDLQNL